MDFLETMQGMTVAGITVICYLAALALKQTPLANKWLPTICGVLGGILGLVGRHQIANYPAQDAISAIAIGIVSGLAATGFDQMIKQSAKEE